MWKELVALARGQRHEACERVVDRNAMVILRQQIRDCAAHLDAARRAVAVAGVQEREERRRAEARAAQVADLEARTLDALDAGKADLAREAAETIAVLEAEAEAARGAADSFAAEINRLGRTVEAGERRLVDLRRGQRLAEVSLNVGRLRRTQRGEAVSSLADAERTLARLRERQNEAEAVDRALDEADAAADPLPLVRRLAEAGCGAPVPGGAEAVLRRLEERRRAGAAPR